MTTRLILTGLCLLVICSEALAERRPNLLFILADDLGCETLGCYGGNSYSTPQLDRLAAEGMRFEHCYSMPVCHPTRVCFLTGRYPFRLDDPGWGTFPVAAESQTLAVMLRQSGYRTAVAGKWQLAMLGEDLDHPHRLGFEDYCLFGWHEGPRYYRPLIWQNGHRREDVADRYGPDVYCDFLIDFISRNRDRPWFAFYSMALCHDVTNDLEAPVPYGPRGRWDSYREMVEGMDDRVGRLMAAIDRLGLGDDTIVMFTGDNGTPKASFIRVDGDQLIREPVTSMLGNRPVRGGKGNLTDDGTRVPLIVRWPGRVAAATETDALIDFSDFLPTFAELAQAPRPRDVPLDGHSFAEVLTGGSARRAWAYAERRDDAWVRTSRYKLYRHGRFFDLEQDPRELKPLANEALEKGAAASRKELEAAFESLAGEG